jgi:hypothetical protein
MKTIFKMLAMGCILMTVAACEKHDFFDENTITGAVGPENYWTIESAAVKAGESMSFVGQYYSTKAEIDHSEVWYDLHMKEDKLVSCALIKSFTHSYTSSILEQQRVLQTIQSYPHSQDLWEDSLRAYVLRASFPVSGTLAPVAWTNPKDTVGFAKNLNAYFGETFAADFKAAVSEKINTNPLNYAAYMEVLKGLSLLDTATLNWMTDSTFDKNSNAWKKHFKQNDSIWSATLLDTIGTRIFDTMRIDKWRDPETRKWVYDTVYYTDTMYYTKPHLDSVKYVYPDIEKRVTALWNDSVEFIDLILGSDGYAIEFNRSFLINAEMRVYDVNGTYSRTDAKEISIL